MRNNYFRKLMNYIKNVYNIERYLYKMKDLIMVLSTGILLQP